MTIQRCTSFLNTLSRSIQTTYRYASQNAGTAPDFEVTVSRVSDHVAIVKLHREQAMNSLSVPVLERLLEVIESFRPSDLPLKAMILTGEGKKAFIAGADIKMFTQPAEGVLDHLLLARRVAMALDRAPFATLAALNGATLGGGLEMALACDLRFAHPGVKLGLPESLLGLIPGCGGTQRLPRVVGEGIAKEMMFTGDPITADRAKAIGLVNDVFPEEELASRTLDIAHKIAQRSLESIQAIKESVNEGRPRQNTPEYGLPDKYQEDNPPLERGEGFEIQGFLKCFQTEEAKQRVSEFLEKSTRKRS